MDTPLRRRWRATACAVLAAFLGSSCSAAPERPDDPYATVIENASAQATSDFERSVFADRQVTRPEYEEAVTRYVRCAHEHGVQLSTIPQAGYFVYTFPDGGDADAVLSRCVDGTTALIEPIFVATLTNPHRDDMDDLIAACVVRSGLATPGYTGAQIKAEKEAARRAGREINLPFDEEDPRFAACMADPTA